MKKYELTFSMGPMSSKFERVYVNAETMEQAEKIAYQMRQAHHYTNLIVSEFQQGESGYIVAFDYYRYANGKKMNHRFEERFTFKATSIEQAKRYFMKKYYGKYQNGICEPKEDKPLENSLKEEWCSIEIGKPFDIYQFNTNPRYYEEYEDATQT